MVYEKEVKVTAAAVDQQLLVGEMKCREINFNQTRRFDAYLDLLGSIQRKHLPC